MGALAACATAKRPLTPYVAPMPPVAPQFQTVLAIDKDGNQVLAGSFAGELVLDKKERLVSRGGTDIFVVKTAADGRVVLGPLHFGGPRDDAATGVAIDSKGNIVLVGTFQGEATFSGKVKADTLREGQRAVFAAKVDAKTGQVLWFKQLAVANLPTQVSVALRSDDSVVIGASGVGSLTTEKEQFVLAGESMMLAVLSSGGSKLEPPVTYKALAFSRPAPCAHSPCTTGGPLSAACGYYACVALVCAWKSGCCANQWDQSCVDAVLEHCGHQCNCNDVTHDGAPFYPDASPCTTCVYTIGGPYGTGDHFCSESSWDSWCRWDMEQSNCYAACHPPCQ